MSFEIKNKIYLCFPSILNPKLTQVLLAIVAEENDLLILHSQYRCYWLLSSSVAKVSKVMFARNFPVAAPECLSFREVSKHQDLSHLAHFLSFKPKSKPKFKHVGKISWHCWCNAFFLKLSTIFIRLLHGILFICMLIYSHILFKGTWVNSPSQSDIRQTFL